MRQERMLDMAISGRLVTADELLRMPHDGYRYELVRGVLCRMAPAGFAHGAVVANLTAPLTRHVKQHRLGIVCGAETGFIIASDPDTVLAPDIAFVRQDRLPASGLPTGFWHGVPDLAVEVLSPGESLREAEDKAAPLMLTASDVLDGGDVVPGFRLPVVEVFAT